MDTTLELDSFTEKLLERTKKRNDFLKSTQQEVLNDLNKKEDFRKEFATKIVDKEDVDLKENLFKPNESAANIVPSSGLKGLAALRCKKDSTNVVTSNEDTKPTVCKVHLKDENDVKSPKGMHSRLAQMAQSFNEQEDDYRYRSPISRVDTSSPKKVTFLDKKTSVVNSSPRPYKGSSVLSKVTPKSFGGKVWDKPMMTSLQTYGFESSDSGKKLTFNFNDNGSDQIVECEAKKDVKCSKKDEDSKMNVEKDTKALSSNKPLEVIKCSSSQASKLISKNDESVDPSCLPLSARRALFEKNMSLNANKAEQCVVPVKFKLFGCSEGSYDSNQEPKMKKAKMDEVKVKEEINFDEVKKLKTEKFESSTQLASLDANLEFQTVTMVNDDEDVAKEKEERKQIETTLGNVDEVASPQGSSTMLYPDLSSFDDTTLDLIPTNLKFKKKTTSNTLSPIKESKLSVGNVMKQAISVTHQHELKPSTPVRTLSMYRREQKMLAAQEERVIRVDHVHQRELDNEKKKREADIKFAESLKMKMKDLQLEAEKYNKIIDQSLRALALCINTENYSERLEAEKILLVNIKKREAIVNHLYHLKDKKNNYDDDQISGCFCIKNLQIGLRGDFLVSQVRDYDVNEHHFICLFTCGDQVVATNSLSSYHALAEAILCFHNRIMFDGLCNNFEVKMEVFCLSLVKEKVAKGIEKKLLSLTPKFITKHKTSSSPAAKSHSVGPNFKLIGCYTFNRNNCSLRSHSLNDFGKYTPLDGSFSMEMSLGAKYNEKYKCYLSFKEQSGEFWVWNRRWCVLDGYLLYYWRYYEDEELKSPVGVINIKECINPTITKASSNISMRENCFAFLTLSKRDLGSPTLHLLAADLRSELEEWLEKLNRVLENVRIWELDAPQPWDEARLDKWMK